MGMVGMMVAYEYVEKPDLKSLREGAGPYGYGGLAGGVVAHRRSHFKADAIMQNQR